MGCFKLTYNRLNPTLKVVYRNPEPQQKVAQRFLSIDPLAEKFAFQPPYAEAANNPIRCIRKKNIR